MSKIHPTHFTVPKMPWKEEDDVSEIWPDPQWEDYSEYEISVKDKSDCGNPSLYFIVMMLTIFIVGFILGALLF